MRSPPACSSPFSASGDWTLDPGAAILGFLPAAGANEALNLTLGLLGLLAAAGTPRRLEARTQVAG